MSSRRLLVISPAFHDYDQAFAAAFTEVGFTVTTHLYDRAEGLAAKARVKLRYELPERFGRDTTDARTNSTTQGVLAAIREARPDVVLVIKGDVLAEDVWDELDRLGIPTVLWLYDELRRTRWDRDRLNRPGRVATYSALDTAALREQGLEAVHVPLGHDHLLPVASRPRSGDVSFIGALYPNRQAVLEALADSGVAVRGYGRQWSHDLRDRLRTWNSARPDLPAGRDLPRAEAYSVMQASEATLNIHGDQDGFTMRTFEAAGVGAVQLIDRADVSELYIPDEEVLVFGSPEEAVEQVQRMQAEPARAERLRKAAVTRTLAEHTLVHRAQALAELW